MASGKSLEDILWYSNHKNNNDNSNSSNRIRSNNRSNKSNDGKAVIKTIAEVAIITNINNRCKTSTSTSASTSTCKDYDDDCYYICYCYCYSYCYCCFDQWHTQASVHALTEPAAIVCLQLQRFTGEAGAIQRDSRLLLGYQCDIHLPVFEGLDDTAVQCLPYKVVAMQLHYGEVPQRDTTAAF